MITSNQISSIIGRSKSLDLERKKKMAKSEENTRRYRGVEISRWVSVGAEPGQPSLVMVLGGKALLWRENGIVFLRSPRATAFPDARGSQGVVSSRSFLKLLRLRFPRHYPAEITFLPVVATSSFVPYLGDPPRKSSKSTDDQDDEEEGDGSWMESTGRRKPPQANRRRHRDEVVKSLARLKIIQGSSLRADASRRRATC